MKKKEPDTVGNLGFLLAIPSSYLLVFICAAAALILASYYPQDKTKWSLFLACALGTTTIISTSQIYKLRILIHEIKHAILVMLTGNKLQTIEVGEREGLVTYLMHFDKKHFAPLITLAPYFLPVISLPILVAAIYYENDYPLFFSSLLGVGFAADLSFGVQDLHPAQTDLKRFFGGFLIAGLFLAGMYLLWGLICILWLIAGSKAYLFIFYGLYRLVNDVISPMLMG